MAYRQIGRRPPRGESVPGKEPILRIKLFDDGNNCSDKQNLNVLTVIYFIYLSIQNQSVKKNWMSDNCFSCFSMITHCGEDVTLPNNIVFMTFNLKIDANPTGFTAEEMMTY